MRYLRMLGNSAFAGLLAAAYFTLLLLLLNPEVPLAAAGAVLTVIVLSYGLHITVVSYALYALRQITVIEPSPPGWISLPYHVERGGTGWHGVGHHLAARIWSSQRTSGVCSMTTTRMSTHSWAMRWPRSTGAICCWSCPDLAWSH
jgi:hypothetical protein